MPATAGGAATDRGRYAGQQHRLATNHAHPSQPGSLWLAGSLFLSGVFLMPVLALLIAGQLQLIRLKRLPGWVDNLAAGMALAVVIVTVLLWAIR